MDNAHANRGIELSDAELAAVQGGFLDWIEKNIFKPLMAVMRGGKPPPNVPVDPQNPFGSNPGNPGSPQRH